MISNTKNGLRPAIAIAVAVFAVGLVAVMWIIMARQATKSHPGPPPETPRREMVQNAGLWYRQGQTNPFTGCMVDYYPNGALLSRCEISNGLPNGLSETWYTNGQIQVREHFKDGVSHGQREKWHENGSRLSLAMIADGKVNGTFRSWYDNGQLSERIEMRAGKPDGTAWAYYPSGFLKAETSVHEGDILQRTSWKDGERTAAQFQ